MKRFILLGVSLVALTWVTGCCHSCHNRCVDWDDGCCADACGDNGGRFKMKRCRHKDRCCRDNGCSVGCDSGCCDGGMATGGLPGYDTSNLTGGGCSACSGGTSTYGGIPIDPSSGWQVVPNSTTSGGSEPTPAPAAGSSGAGLSPMPSSVPVPPPPVSYHTLK